MSEHEHGNRITSNAETADDAKELITKALHVVERAHGFRPTNQETLFTGVYYDSKKVGSYIVRVEDSNKKSAVLKLQLRPLPFDEGSIIRHVEHCITSKKIRPVRVLFDQPWSEECGFGYLLFEDLSHLPKIWKTTPTTAEDRMLHKQFLNEFFTSVLPIAHPWIPLPSSSPHEMIRSAFQHFENIARKSSHRHISDEELRPIIETYKKIMEAYKTPSDLHFTHGHLSGHDVTYDKEHDCFIFMANLYWSWRPKHYEIAFPLWVDLMNIRDKHLTLAMFLHRVQEWMRLYDKETREQEFWYIVFHQAAITIMLDLGASEWTEHEYEEKQKLLNVWKEFFAWIIEHKLAV